MYKISKACPFCGHVSEIWVDDEVLKRMEDGELIQSILPEVPASEREVLISGICINCQEEFDPFEGGYTWDC